MDRDTITALTIAVRVYRKLRAMGIYDMPIELKGIRAKAVKAASNIDRLNAAYDRFNELAPAHAADVEDLVPQIEGLVDDMTFAAQTLGNSVAASGEAEDASHAAPAIPEPKPPQTHPEPPQGQQAAIHTFRAEAEQQIAMAEHKS